MKLETASPDNESRFCILFNDPTVYTAFGSSQSKVECPGTGSISGLKISQHDFYGIQYIFDLLPRKDGP